MTKTRPERRRIRISADAYSTPGAVFSVTVGTSPRREVFADPEFGAECIEILRRLRASEGNPTYAFCLMPDHAHLLVGVVEGSTLQDFVGRWKSLCFQAWRRRGRKQGFWQRSFFDRAVRQEANLRTTAWYILQNPVRAGLTNAWTDYSLCGSLEFEF